jgi:hypothetical protein
MLDSYFTSALHALESSITLFQHTYAEHTAAYVSIRQHTSAYASITLFPFVAARLSKRVREVGGVGGWGGLGDWHITFHLSPHPV